MDGAAPPSTAQNSCRRSLEQGQAIAHTPARIPRWRNASYFARKAFAKLRQSRLCKAIELTSLCVLQDSLVEPLRLERLEPGAENRKIARRQTRNGLFDLFDAAHDALTLASRPRGDQYAWNTVGAIRRPLKPIAGNSPKKRRAAHERPFHCRDHAEIAQGSSSGRLLCAVFPRTDNNPGPVHHSWR